MLMRDDVGDEVAIPRHVGRVVSLVPSLTESIAVTAPGLLVGATDWCTHPPDLDVTRVKGTKRPDIGAVLALRPDLVVANEEENRPQDVAALRAAGLSVWVTAPRTVPGAIRSLDRMLIACGCSPPAWLCAVEHEWTTPDRASPGRRAFVPIWRRPWMALGQDTFAGDVLARLGVDNVYGDHAQRYPRVTLEDAAERRPELVVLPDEPYPFSRGEGRAAFGDWGVPVVHVSGRHLTWYGPSMVEARAALTSALTDAFTNGRQW